MDWPVLRVLLSFNPKDVALAEAFRASLFVASPDLEVFFSPTLFEEYRPLKLERADAFVLFVGRNGLTDRQQAEYHAFNERENRDSRLVVVRVLAGRAEVPEGLPGNPAWIRMPVVTDRKMVQQVVDALGQFGGLTDRSSSKTLIGTLLTLLSGKTARDKDLAVHPRPTE